MSRINRRSIVWRQLDELYYDIHQNKIFNTGIEQGTLTIGRLSNIAVWYNIYLPDYRTEEYCVLRFIQKDSKGNAVLKYRNIYDYDKTKPNDVKFNELIELPKRNLDRIKYHHLYIEKTLNKGNGGFVDNGEILIYKIIIKNKGEKNYTNDLIVTENLCEYVTYENHYETKGNLIFKYDLHNRQLTWNIGKLKSGEEVIIYYYVKVTKGKSGDIIENPGFVGNIPSSRVTYTFGRNLDNKKKELIKNNFEKLKNKYNGKKLINEIYKQSFYIDMKFDEFDIKQLIINQENLYPQQPPLIVNTNHTFTGAILNQYWNTLKTLTSSFIEGGEEVELSKLFGFDFPERQRFIYSDNFRTGDILLYINNIDESYNLDSNKKLVKHVITYESGEYAYIYNEGKGFVGVNTGNDKNNIKDDRKEFNANYYKVNKLELFHQETSTNLTDEFLEMANLQTVFCKDYYVILRPSVIFDFEYINNTWITILVVIILLILIISISFVILKIKRINIIRNINKNLLGKGTTN